MKVWISKKEKTTETNESARSLHKEEEAEDGETEDVHRKQMETESDSAKRKGRDAQEKIDRKKKNPLSLNLAKKIPRTSCRGKSWLQDLPDFWLGRPASGCDLKSGRS